MSQQPAIVNFQANQGTQQSIGIVETIITNQKELYEHMLASKDAEIARMEKIIDRILNKSNIKH